jgi:hypothetical protein
MASMASVTAGFGLVLVVLGLGGYFASRRVSVTALIPTFIGLPILVLGLIAQAHAAEKYAVIAAIVVALVGFAGAARGLPKGLRMLSGTQVERPFAAVMQSVMAVLCLGYAIWAISWLVG